MIDPSRGRAAARVARLAGLLDDASGPVSQRTIRAVMYRDYDGSDDAAGKKLQLDRCVRLHGAGIYAGHRRDALDPDTSAERLWATGHLSPRAVFDVLRIVASSTPEARAAANAALKVIALSSAVPLDPGELAFHAPRAATDLPLSISELVTKWMLLRAAAAKVVSRGVPALAYPLAHLAATMPMEDIRAMLHSFDVVPWPAGCGDVGLVDDGMSIVPTTLRTILRVRLSADESAAVVPGLQQVARTGSRDERSVAYRLWRLLWPAQVSSFELGRPPAARPSLERLACASAGAQDGQLESSSDARLRGTDP